MEGANHEEWQHSEDQGEQAADEEANGLATTDDSLSRILIVEPPAAA